jgi:AdoMet dependent proline di-methyltransferase
MESKICLLRRYLISDSRILKTQDNCTVDWTFVVDKEDNSVARCREYIRLLIKIAGLEIVTETLQTDFPKELYPVTTFAIGRPANATSQLI